MFYKKLPYITQMFTKTLPFERNRQFTVKWRLDQLHVWPVMQLIEPSLFFSHEGNSFPMS